MPTGALRALDDQLLVENLRERLISVRYYLESLVIFVLVLSTNSEIEIQFVVIQYQRNSITTGPTVHTCSSD